MGPSPEYIKEVIPLSESFQVAHKGSNTGGGRGNVGEMAVAKQKKFSSDQPQRGKLSSSSESNKYFKYDRIEHIASNCCLCKFQSKPLSPDCCSKETAH